MNAFRISMAFMLALLMCVGSLTVLNSVGADSGTPKEWPASSGKFNNTYATNWVINTTGLFWANRTIMVHGDLQLNSPGSITFRNCTITVEGNVNVTSGTSLILEKSILRIHNNYDVEHNITVFSGGVFKAKEIGLIPPAIVLGSTITSNNTFKYNLFANKGADILIRRSMIFNCGLDIANPGILVRTDKAKFESNLISGCMNGITVERANVTIYNNTIASCDTGIFLRNHVNATIDKNRIFNNNFAGIMIMSNDESKVLLVNNTIYSNKFYGVNAGSSDNLKFINNTIRDHANSAYGVYLDECDDCYFGKNQILSNNNGGIHVYSSDNITYIDNYFYDNYGSVCSCGIYQYDTSNCKIIHNVFYKNRDYGVFLDYYSNNNLIADNIIDNNNYQGIYIKYYSDNNVIRNNSVSYNQQDGIYLYYYCQNNRIENNIINYNTNEGITAYDNCDNLLISNNTIDHNYYTGVYIGGSKNPTITNNSISYTINGAASINLNVANSDNAVIANNSIIGKDQYGDGIDISGSNSLIIYNTVYANSVGIILYSGSTCKVYNNSLANRDSNAYDNDGLSLWNYNYYGNYTGIDTNGNFIGDTNLPYQIASPTGFIKDAHPRTKITTNCNSTWTYAMISKANSVVLNNAVIHLPATTPGAGSQTIPQIGFYIDNVLLNSQHDLQFAGEGVGKVFVDGNWNNDVFGLYNSHRITFNGTTIQNGNDGAGIYLEYSGANITNTEFSGNGRGIYASTNAIFNASWCNIHDSIMEGIYIIESNSNSITNSTSVSSKNDAGISLYLSDDNWIVDNIITDNHNAGIRADTSDDNIVLRNQLLRNNHLGACSCGIYLTGSGFWNIQGNNITDNYDFGVFMESGSDHNLIKDNRMNDNYNNGIHVLNSWYNQIIGNEINGNNHAYAWPGGGVVLDHAYYTNITNNHMESNGDENILIYYSEYNEVWYNNLTDSGDGVHLEYAYHNNVSFNDISWSGDGVYLNQADHNNVTYNNLTYNDYGFYDNYADYNYFAFNYVYMSYSSNFGDSGSCPMLWTWDGEKMVRNCDINGPAMMGTRRNTSMFGGPSGAYKCPNPTDYTAIDSSLLVPKDGYYTLDISEDQNEISFLDSASLWVIDHSADTEIYSPEAAMATVAKGLFPPVIHTVKDPKPPRSAFDYNGNDVLAEVSELDGIKTDALPSNDNYITLDLGNLAGASQIKLIYNANITYKAGTGGWVPIISPWAEVKDEYGNWVMVSSTEHLGTPENLARTFVIDITSWFKTNDYSLRLHTGNAYIYVDWIAVDTSVDEAVTVTKLDPVSAENHYTGRTHSDFEYFYGLFTKYGNVLPLVTAKDDMFVVMRTGDGVTMKFPEQSAPAEGRDFWLVSNAYFKIASKSRESTVEPMPFGAMSNWPYKDTEHYPTDAAHQQYLSDWNTRIYDGTDMGGGSFPWSEYNLIVNNTIIGDENSYGLGFEYEYGTTVMNNTIMNCEYGVYGEYMEECYFINNDISNMTSDGIYLGYADDIGIFENRITDCYDGMYLYDMYYFNVDENTITNCSYAGIWIYECYDFEIYDNVLKENMMYGAYLDYYTRWFDFDENFISDSIYGIYVYGIYECGIYDNTILNNYYGYYVSYYYDPNIWVVHNDFINNKVQAYDGYSGWAYYDDGYPSGGNFWSDYTGQDLYYGPDQDQPGNDGIGDVYYAINKPYWYNTDNYPLMYAGNDYEPPALTDLTGSPMTGAALTFTATATDNVDVKDVYVNYTFDSGTWTNMSLVNLFGDTYLLTVNVPMNASSLQYIIGAVDYGNNRNETTIDEHVMDIFAPEISDLTATVGYTGDDFTFQANVTDNVGVSGVMVKYWVPGSPGGNSTMTNAGTDLYSYTSTIPINITTGFYTIFAHDMDGNWADTGVRIIGVLDNDAPNVTDLSPAYAATGSDYTFKATVTDNIAVKDVSVLFWTDASGPQNATMSGDASGNYTLTTTLPISATKLNYTIMAFDTSMNFASSAPKMNNVADIIAPALSDRTPSTPTTGDNLTFEVTVGDNIGIVSVNVLFWTDVTTMVNETMESSRASTYSYTMTVPSNANEMHYKMSAKDANGNWGSIKTVDLTVADNDLPLLEDRSGSAPTTGDPFTFKANASDNVGLFLVGVYYSFDSGFAQNITLNETAPGVFEAVIDVPSNAESLEYTLFTVDLWTNMFGLPKVALAVSDNDAPALTDSSQTTGTTSDLFEFDLVSVDNIGTTSVSVSFWYGEDANSTTVEAADRAGDDWTYSMNLPSDNLAPLRYTVTATDAAGNSVTSPEKSVPMTDNDAPLVIVENIQAKVNTTVKFDGSMSIDNIGITRYTWTFSDMGKAQNLSGVDPSYTFKTIGPYFVVLTVSDAAGNIASVEFVVRVTMNEVIGPDADGDGYNDTVDKFPYDPTEWADNDADGIGDNADTDDDNDDMPDVWEEAYGLDTKDSGDKTQDPDADGISNIDEYTGGTSPRHDDRKKSDETSGAWGANNWLWMLIAVIIIAIIVIVAVLLMRRKKTDEDEAKAKTGDAEEAKEENADTADEEAAEEETADEAPKEEATEEDVEKQPEDVEEAVAAEEEAPKEVSEEEMQEPPKVPDVEDAEVAEEPPPPPPKSSKASKPKGDKAPKKTEIKDWNIPK